MTLQGSRTDFRLATISALVKHAPHALGRTAMMKLIYFLQTLHKVPLGYDFRIYTYGPYDSQVLEDLKVAELKGGVKSSVVGYAIGNGYAIAPGAEADAVVGRSSSVVDFIPKINSVLAEFGNRSATDLEMASTIVFVVRAEASSGKVVPLAEATRKVQEMKPRLDFNRILQEAIALKDKGYIAAV
jgi:uncharacterized protein